MFVFAEPNFEFINFENTYVQSIYMYKSMIFLIAFQIYAINHKKFNAQVHTYTHLHTYRISLKLSLSGEIRLMINCGQVKGKL